MTTMADTEYSSTNNRKNSNTQLLEELEALSQTIYQSHTSTSTSTSTSTTTTTKRRTPSLALLLDDPKNNHNPNPTKPRTRRMSLTPWRSRSHSHSQTRPNDQIKDQPSQNEVNRFTDNNPSSDKKGSIWNWKPIRALSHIGMHKMTCLFSVEVVTIQNLPATMNGLRLSVCVRKRESKDDAVNTMPSRVSQGVADFEETLFIRCNVYCGNAHSKFEARPFLIYAFAADAPELDFGRTSVDLSRMIDESVRMSSEGTRVRQWDVSFNLNGKAEGGELVLKLGFQLMEKNGGIGIYSSQSGNGRRNLASLSARRQSKGSFSIASPRLSEDWRPSNSARRADLQVIVDDPAPEVDLLDFDVVEKGVEIQEKKLVSGEIVKEVVQDRVMLNRLSELDSIARQIKALESLMVGEEKSMKKTEEAESQKLDSDEETVSKEFLQMLEDEDAKEFKLNQIDHVSSMKLDDSEEGEECKVFLPDLGKTLGCVVQTKDGGYLISMNPLDNEMEKKDTPKLAIQTSKPLVLTSMNKSVEGFELFQRIAGLGYEALNSEISSLMPMDEIIGKTAEQVAFEGIASAIINGRNKEGASSSAARTISAVKTMATAMTNGRSDRISTGVWNVGEDPRSIEETLAFSMQKIEEITIEALKIQAEMAEEDAPFDVSPMNQIQSLASLVSSEISDSSSSSISIIVVLQLRDPIRRYEAVGGPMIALINATKVADDDDDDERERRLKIGSLHVGGMKVRSGGKSEKQRLTGMQWLVGYGLVGKKRKQIPPSSSSSSSSRDEDLFWSISSRVVADMWLKPIRNPNVKLTN
ncbi:protein PLASTID MOVEMENT IMPAIRED 1-like [Impatiens glandulifera]|uniref:protein PLASTID MOVEMENT IMPAIRED 1-like n=1 Tax=Impatiens glandulifera TaxID=253017 RepID=UPI001FB12F2F|nr:protein PLASTID MOVEMENT IMPAIRED 1-like [Impatiens glandulifera]